MNFSKKRIAIVCSPLSTNGGTINHLLSWCRNLDRSKFEPTLFCNFTNAEQERLAEVKFNEIPDIRFVPLKNIFPLKRLLSSGWLSFVKTLRKFKPHLIHSIFVQADILCAITQPLTGCPIQISSWEGKLASQVLHNHLKIKLYQTMMLLAQRFISRFIAISAATGDQNCHDFGIDARKVSVIHSGLNLARFPFKPERDSKTIGLVSRLTSEKQIDIFVRAIPLIARHHPNYRFIIAGDGPERAKLEALAESCGVRDITEFVGWQNDVSSILDKLEMLAFTSSGEGLPWTILEAMAAGCPVVASAVGGIPEAIENEKTGLLIDSNLPEDFAENLKYLVKNREKRIAIATQARKKVESTFSESAEIKAIEQLYCELLF
ncbi:MAG TPA: glycosyltransferase family 4 protein [Candidatus Rifleibacterium sp.]|nr:glycosyltransferase family 4 protein [Candidatus Rifleibacterium sp.]